MLDFTLAYSEGNAGERNPAAIELGRLIEQAEWARHDKPTRRPRRSVRTA